MPKYSHTTIMLLFIFAQLLMGCSQPEPAAAPAVEEPVTITFYKRGYVEGGDDVTSVTNKQAVEAFERRNPNINVEIVGVPWSNEGTVLLDEALASGDNINVFSVTPGNLIGLAREGKVSNIEPFLTEEDQADFYTNGLQAAAVDGKVYAWPIWVVTFSIFANPDIFAERGVPLPTLEEPWTWDEFLAAAKQLSYQKPDGTQVYGFTAPSVWWSMQNFPIYYIDGGRVFSPDGKRFVQNNADAVSGLQKIVELYQQGIVPPGYEDQVTQDDNQELFKNGEVAMQLTMPAYIRELEEGDYPVTVLPIPTGDLGKLVTTGAFGMYAVYNSDDPAKLAASHEFAKYITGSQVALDVPGYQLAPSLRRSNQSFATSPNRAAIAKLVEYGIFEAPVNISTDLNARYGETLKQVVLGEKTAQAAMDELAPLFQKELDEVWK
ncbi:MAG: hypothetical protein Kow0031_33120 [Anaerolineae bacterium]